MLLKGKTAIITGANRGIGRAAAKCFCDNGATVYAVCRTDAACGELERETHPGIIPVLLDITDTKGAQREMQRIRKEAGALDILVNNAGIMEDALIGMITRELIERVFSINVYAPILLSQLAARFMRKQNSGVIINVASLIGVNGNAGQSVYAASKGAVISFTKSASKELAPYGIRVNAVAPGMIDTQLLDNVPEEKRRQRLESVGLGRLGKPEEVAEVITFLASNMASYITGQIIGIDGGAVI